MLHKSHAERERHRFKRPPAEASCRHHTQCEAFHHISADRSSRPGASARMEESVKAGCCGGMSQTGGLLGKRVRWEEMWTLYVGLFASFRS